MNKIKKEIPIFTATDDNYVPFLAVTLQSMLENASKDYNYTIKILNTGISEDNINKIKKYEKENVNIEFVDMKKSLEEIGLRLHTCIYYTQTTYYRLFIASLYPQYDKVLYIDCDVAVTGDISKLYNINIGDNLVGATTDEFVVNFPKIHQYMTGGLGVNKVSDYFNAGVLIMNLKQFRIQNFEEQFVDLLAKYKFVVQDQDYLNVICKNKVHYISGSWDKMPCKDDMEVSKVNLIHYNLIWKPWHAEVPYGDIFWNYADKTEYKDIIHNIRDNYTAEQYQKDIDNFNMFMDKIVEDGKNPNNYYNMYVNSESDGEEAFSFAESEVMA
ncbi:MAG: glycosyltransferase family 8 protein [Clostridia bacterium]|nr:glycosyltransferase family 8 protein [Clostridia bacterium]